MDGQISTRIQKLDEVLSNVDSIRVLLYLAEYNPNVLLEDLSKNLKIDSSMTIKIVSALIHVDLVEKQGNMYQLSEIGRLTTTNLKNL